MSWTFFAGFYIGTAVGVLIGMVLAAVLAANDRKQQAPPRQPRDYAEHKDNLTYHRHDLP